VRRPPGFCFALLCAPACPLVPGAKRGGTRTRSDRSLRAACSNSNPRLRSAGGAYTTKGLIASVGRCLPGLSLPSLINQPPNRACPIERRNVPPTAPTGRPRAASSLANFLEAGLSARSIPSKDGHPLRTPPPNPFPSHALPAPLRWGKASRPAWIGSARRGPLCASAIDDRMHDRVEFKRATRFPSPA